MAKKNNKKKSIPKGRRKQPSKKKAEFESKEAVDKKEEEELSDDKSDKPASEEEEVDTRKSHSPKEVAEIKRLRKNLYNKKYRIKKKLGKAPTKRERKRLNRQILDAQNQIIFQNKELGYVRKFKEIPEKRVVIKEQGAVQESTFPVWDARDKITDMVKGGYYEIYVVGEEEFLKKEIAGIYQAFSDLEDFAYTYGRSTPFVVFIEDVATKEAVINVY